MAEPTGRVTFGKELDLQISHNETSVFRLDFERQSAVHRVVLELVDGVIEREKGIVDGGDRGVGIVQGGAEHEATDTAESVDTERNSHAGEPEVAKRKDRWKQKQTELALCYEDDGRPRRILTRRDANPTRIRYYQTQSIKLRNTLRRIQNCLQLSFTLMLLLTTTIFRGRTAASASFRGTTENASNHGFASTAKRRTASTIFFFTSFLW